MVSFHHDSSDLSTVHPVGAITAASAPILKDALQTEMASAPRSLIFDLNAVPMIDSTGLGVIVATKKNLNEAGLRFGIIHVQPTVEKVLEIVRLSKHLNVFSSREELDDYLISVQQKMVEENDTTDG